MREQVQLLILDTALHPTTSTVRILIQLLCAVAQFAREIGQIEAWILFAFSVLGPRTRSIVEAQVSSGSQSTPGVLNAATAQIPVDPRDKPRISAQTNDIEYAMLFTPARQLLATEAAVGLSPRIIISTCFQNYSSKEKISWITQILNTPP